MTQDDVEPARFERRKTLLASFDNWRREVEAAPVDGLDSFYRKPSTCSRPTRWPGRLTSRSEDPRLRDRYGVGSSKHLGDGAPMWNDQLLIARRLVEAGARCVTVAYGFWDTHGNNFGHLKKHLPLFDQGISALVEDLHAQRACKTT